MALKLSPYAMERAKGRVRNVCIERAILRILPATTKKKVGSQQATMIFPTRQVSAMA
jgi:hypothetical protein